MRALVTPLLLAAAGLVPAAPLVSQSLADRIARVQTGTVRLSYATRSIVCGNGEFIGFDLPDAFYSYSNWRDGYSINVMRDVKPDCRGGPLRLVVVRASDRVAELRAAVGVTWRASETAVDLGTVSAPEAADWLVRLAESSDDHGVVRTAFLAAAAADSARITDRILGIVGNRQVAANVRERAIRWAGIAAGVEGRADEVDRVLRALAADAGEPTELRERAIRDLRATVENRAYLRTLYGRIADVTLRERIVREVAPDGTDDDVAWLRGIALDGAESATVRERAIRVLGELDRASAVRALYARLDNRALRERALRVAAERGDDATMRWLRQVAEDGQDDPALRERAIRLLADHGRLDDLRDLYPRLDRIQLKERVLRTVADHDDAAAAAWLADIVLNDGERAARRDRAVRSLAEAGAPSGDLAALYDRVSSSTVKQRLIRVLADRHDEAAAEKLAAIAARDPDAGLRREAERRRR